MEELTQEQKDAIAYAEIEERKMQLRALISSYTREISIAEATLRRATADKADAEQRLAVLDEQYPSEGI